MYHRAAIAIRPEEIFDVAAACDICLYIVSALKICHSNFRQGKKVCSSVL